MNRFISQLIVLILIAIASYAIFFTVGFYLFENRIEAALINFSTLNEQSSKFETIVTPSKVLAINSIILFCSITLIYKFKKISDLIVNEWKWFIGIFNDVILSVVKSKTGLIIIFPTAALLFLASTFTVTYDEALSYSLFISRGPLVSITYYPVPNNHIFFSLMSTFITSIFSYDPVLLMRLFSVISFVISGFFIFRLLNIFLLKEVSILICALYLVMPFTLYYGFLGRGYSFIALLFFISAYILCVQNIEKTYDFKIGIFSFLSAIGIYTIPSYLYAFFINLVLILFFLKVNSIKVLFKSIILTFSMALILYAPVIVFSGIDALINNEYVESQNRVKIFYELPNFIFETFTKIFNSKILAILFLLNMLIIGIKSLSKYKSSFDRVILIIFLVPIILITLQGVQPPPRVFTFWYSILVLSSYIYFYKQTNFFQNINPVFVSIFIQILILFNTVEFPKKMVFNDPFAAKYSEIISRDHISILSTVDHINTFLLYEKTKNKYQNMKVNYAQKNDDWNVQEKYDWVILNKGESAPAGYQEIYNENEWVFYRNL